MIKNFKIFINKMDNQNVLKSDQSFDQIEKGEKPTDLSIDLGVLMGIIQKSDDFPENIQTEIQSYRLSARKSIKEPSEKPLVESPEKSVTNSKQDVVMILKYSYLIVQTQV